MTEPTPGNDVAALSYEEAREQLIAVVGRLEAGGASLEESLALWERGEALAARCEEWLEGARKRLAAARDQPLSGLTAPGANLCHQERRISSRSVSTSKSALGHSRSNPDSAPSSSC
jgi:exodeoxyribonuclease VII small subunit